MLKSKQIQLGDDSFQITQFTAGKGVRYFRLISKYTGPIIGLMGAKAGDGDAVNEAVNALLDNLDDDKIDKLIQEMIAASGFVKSDGGEVRFDFYFAGAYDKLITLLVEIVKFNFGSVFQSSVLGNLSAQLPVQD